VPCLPQPAITGIQISLVALRGGTNWLTIIVVIAVAITAKLLGSSVPGRLSGLDTRSAAGLGVMMTCRGLTELHSSNDRGASGRAVRP